MRETEYNGGRFGCFTARDVTCKRSIKLSKQDLVPMLASTYRMLRPRLVGGMARNEGSQVQWVTGPCHAPWHLHVCKQNQGPAHFR